MCQSELLQVRVFPSLLVALKTATAVVTLEWVSQRDLHSAVALPCQVARESFAPFLNASSIVLYVTAFTYASPLVFLLVIVSSIKWLVALTGIDQQASPLCPSRGAPPSLIASLPTVTYRVKSQSKRLRQERALEAERGLEQAGERNTGAELQTGTSICVKSGVGFQTGTSTCADDKAHRQPNGTVAATSADIPARVGAPVGGVCLQTDLPGGSDLQAGSRTGQPAVQCSAPVAPQDELNSVGLSRPLGDRIVMAGAIPESNSEGDLQIATGGDASKLQGGLTRVVDGELLSSVNSERGFGQRKGFDRSEASSSDIEGSKWMSGSGNGLVEVDGNTYREEIFGVVVPRGFAEKKEAAMRYRIPEVPAKGGLEDGGSRRNHVPFRSLKDSGSCVLSGSILWGEEEELSCPICLCVYAHKALLRVLPCQHHFHQSCADTWLLINACCPLCKADMRSAALLLEGGKGDCCATKGAKAVV